MNQIVVKRTFRLDFLKNYSNVVCVGTVGLGKIHLGLALNQCAREVRCNVFCVAASNILEGLKTAQHYKRLEL